MLATTPLAFRVNENGVAVLFRYGVVVLIGLNALEEEEFLRGLQSRMTGPFERRDEEIAVIELSGKGGPDCAGGPICLQSLSPERLILVAEVLAKSVVLARHEREVATRLRYDRTACARTGAERADQRRSRFDPQTYRQRVVGASPGDGARRSRGKARHLWDKPHLERLYARLEDEYELKERAESLNRKLAVIAETAQVLTDIIDTRRSLRLEVIIVLLILFEVIITIYQLAVGRHLSLVLAKRARAGP